MSPRTVCAPPTDAALWRRLTARAHPDAGGDHDLFIWANSVRDYVLSGVETVRPRPDYTSATGAQTGEMPQRIPFEWGLDFEELTRRALRLASELKHPFRGLLELLHDCFPVDHGRPALEQMRGATYKQLALIGHRKGLTKEQRQAFYRISEQIPLSHRHAGHIIEKLQGGR
jgi:hypothetical protein